MKKTVAGLKKNACEMLMPQVDDIKSGTQKLPTNKYNFINILYPRQLFQLRVISHLTVNKLECHMSLLARLFHQSPPGIPWCKIMFSTLKEWTWRVWMTFHILMRRKCTFFDSRGNLFFCPCFWKWSIYSYSLDVLFMYSVSKILIIGNFNCVFWKNSFSLKQR